MLARLAEESAADGAPPLTTEEEVPARESCTTFTRFWRELTTLLPQNGVIAHAIFGKLVNFAN